MLKKHFIIITLIVFSNQTSYGQYLISGYLQTEQKNKTVYLSLLKYNETHFISTEQILYATETDSLGFFKMKGQLLSEKDALYRIHSNLDYKRGLQLFETDSIVNFHNFIFSNTDTLFFPKQKNKWFSQAINTNKTDSIWHKSIAYKDELLEEYPQTQNEEIKKQIIDGFANRQKLYSRNFLFHPLLKLLVFSEIKKKGFDIKEDFKKNENYYYQLRNDLKKYYSDNSYFLQYQEELSKITHSIITQKYVFHKNLNYFLAFLVVLLLSILLIFIRKTSVLKGQEISTKNSTLTQQEEKIVKLIYACKTNKEIAEKLFISLNTVKTHIRNLYSKLNVENRQQLIAKIKNHPKD